MAKNYQFCSTNQKQTNKTQTNVWTKA